MIFKTSIELVNYVLSHYPYEKILTYCEDMNYKFCFVRGCSVVDIHKPSKWDIAKFLVSALGEFVANDISRNSRSPTSEDAKVMKVGLGCQDVNLYFRVHRGIGNSLVIVFNYSYFGYRFKKYTKPYYNPRYSNPRTKVVFKFKGEEELI